MRQLRALGLTVALALAASACSGSEDVATARPCEPVTTPAVQRPTLVDATADLGLDNVTHWTGYDWETPPSPEEDDERYRHMPAIMSGGITVADVDNDGWEDLYATRVGAPDRLYRNICGERFIDITDDLNLASDGSNSTAIFFDADNDGDLDLLTIGIIDTPHRLFINHDGIFTDEANDRGIRRQDWSGASHTMGATAADYDQDGDLDLFLSAWQPPTTDPLEAGTSQLLRNDGTGVFTDVTTGAGLALTDVAAFTATFADLNGDSSPDLAVAGDWGTSRLFISNGDGTFTDQTRAVGVGQERNGMGSAVADLNHDGSLDWFVSSIHADIGCGSHDFECDGNRLYLQHNPGAFTEEAITVGLEDGSWGWGVEAADLNNDQRLDLVLVNGFENGSAYNPSQADAYQPFVTDASRLWIQADDANFTNAAQQWSFNDQGNGKAVVSADLDNDGDLDLIIGNTETGMKVFRNDQPEGNAWLRVRPILANGAPAIGATIEVDRLATPIRQDIRAGDTYQGQRSAIAHIGLGPSEDLPPMIDVTIHWPDGESSSHDLEHRQGHTVMQPGS